MTTIKISGVSKPSLEVTLDDLLMEEMMDVLSETSRIEGLGMLCLGLSFLYRSMMEDPRPGVAMTIPKFLSLVLKHTRHFIENPPEGYEDQPPTENCTCPVCTAKRERLARAH